MPKTKTPLLIPFLGKSMMDYVGYDDSKITWREAKPFKAVIALDGCHRGRSAARVSVWNTSNNEEYSLGFASFFEAVALFGVIKDSKGQPARIDGYWTFRKQGSNYSLFPLDPNAQVD